MKRFIGLGILIFVMDVSSLHGANVTVHAEGLFDYYDDPMELLPFAEPAPGTVFQLQFTYDSDTLPSNSDTTFIANYDDAILDFALTIGSDSFGLLETNRIPVSNDYDLGDGLIYGAWNAYTNSLIPTGNGDDLYSVTIRMRLGTNLDAPPVPPLTSTDLVPPQWPSQWEWGQIVYNITLIDDSGARPVATSRASITSISIVPLPATAWLMMSAIGLLGWTRRRIT